METNLILNVDSYKMSFYTGKTSMYPPNATSSFSYIESRGGKHTATLFFGLQYILKEYLCKPITQENIDEAREFAKGHGVPFNEEGWDYILKAHGGYLPLRIRAVLEGTLVPNHNPLVTIESTDEKCFWLTSYIETCLLKVWYPTSVATRSYFIRQKLFTALETSCENPLAEIDFRHLAFGYRGNSSEESARIGGMAELISFKGSDTIAGILAAKKYYHCQMAGFSVAATEHSWTLTRTYLRNMLNLE